MPLVVGDGQRVDRLGPVDPLKDPFEGLPGRGVGVRRHVLRAHAAPDGADRVVEDGRGQRLLLRVELAHQTGGDLGGQLVDQTGAIVRVELGEDLADPAVVQVVDELGLQWRVERLEHVGRGVLGQEPEHHRPVLGAASLEDIDHQPRRHLVQDLGGVAQIPGVDQGVDATCGQYRVVGDPVRRVVRGLRGIVDSTGRGAHVTPLLTGHRMRSGDRAAGPPGTRPGRA